MIKRKLFLFCLPLKTYTHDSNIIDCPNRCCWWRCSSVCQIVVLFFCVWLSFCWCCCCTFCRRLSVTTTSAGAGVDGCHLFAYCHRLWPGWSTWALESGCSCYWDRQSTGVGCDCDGHWCWMGCGQIGAVADAWDHDRRMYRQKCWTAVVIGVWFGGDCPSGKEIVFPWLN